jgi:tetratricopeptide (TPR) repeat protein
MCTLVRCRLGCVPLALEIAGGTVASHRAAGFAGFLSDFDSSDGGVVLPLTATPEEKELVGLSRLYSMSWFGKDVSREAHDALLLLAYAAPDDVPAVELLLACVGALPERSPLRTVIGTADPTGANRTHRKLAAQRVVDQLVNVSLASHSQGGDCVLVHRLIQLVVRTGRETDMKPCRDAARALVMGLAAVDVWDASATRVADALGKWSPHLHEVGDETSHVRCALSATDASRDGGGSSSIHVAIAACVRAEAIYAFTMGKLADALKLRQQELNELRLAHPAGHHPDVGTCLADVASVLRARGQHSDAREVEMESLASRKALQSARLGARDKLRVLAGIAANWSTLGRYERALKHAGLALELQRKALPAGDQDTVSSLIRIAEILSALGRDGEALERVNEALGALPASHPDLATCLNNRAKYLSALGRHEGALADAVRALEMRRVASPCRRADVAASLVNVARIQCALAEHGAALESATEALGKLCELLPRDHRDIAACMADLAGYESKVSGHDATALGHAKRALEIRREVLPNGHPDVSSSLMGLAALLGAGGNHAEALACAEEALAMRTAAHPGHADVGASLVLVARSLSAQGRHGESRARVEQALGHAATRGHLPVVTALLAAGANNEVNDKVCALRGGSTRMIACAASVVASGV